ncbi:MAG: hypothetical protein AB7H77_01875 [Bdellovibrionales bacterium]
MRDGDPNRVPEHAWERLALVPAKLKARGAGWLAKRLREEIRRAAHTLYIFISGALRRLACFFFSTQLSKGSLFAIYDLEYYPISYDICWFLVWADLERRKKGLQRLQCVLVPCRDEATRKYPDGYNEVVDSQSRSWRFHNICAPAVSLVPGTGSIMCSSRSWANDVDLISRARIPSGSPPPLSSLYRQTIAGLTAQGANWQGLSASVQGRRYVTQWLEAHIGQRKAVVITLRQYGVDVERNSALEEWAAFAHSLNMDIYCPVIVPDTDNSMAPEGALSGLPLFTPAAWNIGLRMALYELAHLNMFVNSGPGSLCILNRQCRYLFFKVTAATYLASEDMLRQMGFERNTSPSFATPFQKWVWEPDNRAILRREFNAMTAKIESAAPCPWPKA